MALTACGGGGGANAPSVWVPSASIEVMGISTSARLDPQPTDERQRLMLDQEAVDMAYEAGARGQFTSVTWRKLEPQLDQIEASELNKLQREIDRAEAAGMVPLVGIQLINTAFKEVPAELASQAFDSPAMKARFHGLLDRIIVPNKGKIRYLSIGNEVDVYLRAHPAEWAAYRRFYADAAAHARSLDPGLQVGVTSTALGATDTSSSELRSLNEFSDVLVLTYYPLVFDAAFTVTVKPPTVVASDFKQMLSVAGTRPLILQEVGYPAATSNQSSENLQSSFVVNVFSAWKADRARIPFLNFFMLHDFPAPTCIDFAAFYEIAQPESFEDFLCSLGLLQASGTPRKAWATLKGQAAAMGLP